MNKMDEVIAKYTTNDEVTASRGMNPKQVRVLEKWLKSMDPMEAIQELGFHNEVDNMVEATGLKLVSISVTGADEELMEIEVKATFSFETLEVNIGMAMDGKMEVEGVTLVAEENPELYRDLMAVA